MSKIWSSPTFHLAKPPPRDANPCDAVVFSWERKKASKKKSPRNQDKGESGDILEMSSLLMLRGKRERQRYPRITGNKEPFPELFEVGCSDCRQPCDVELVIEFVQGGEEDGRRIGLAVSAAGHGGVCMPQYLTDNRFLLPEILQRRCQRVPQAMERLLGVLRDILPNVFSRLEVVVRSIGFQNANGEEEFCI